MNTRLASFLRVALFFLLIVVLVWSSFYPQSAVFAATTLTVTPLTWNIIGLDSNNVNVGPNDFPIGARVCNTGSAVATNVTATLVWDSANSYIDYRSGTSSSLSVTSLAINACTDFYFEVEVQRNSLAYNTTLRYHIAVTADGGATTGSTPIPRELYVEHLISQNRNTVSDIQYGLTIPTLTSVASGGTMTLLVGETYYIRIVGATATQGYEQIESFITIPNTVFQILSVDTTYSAESSATLSPPYDKLYGDACVWENDPNSPNYRACNSTGKAGGNVTVTYQVKILQVPQAPLVNPQPLSTLIYDFSGSSFHYNADLGTSTRFAYILDPSAVTLSKSFNPDPTTVGGISTLTFTITNPTPASFSGLNFSDTLPTTPGNMTVASPPSASTTGCGSPTFSPTANATSISFSNGSIAANSSCTIKVNVTVSATGTYTNTSSHLLIGTLDTGNSATDTLTVNAASTPSAVCGLAIAQWTFPSGFDTSSPAPSSGSGTASPGAGITSTSFSEGTNSWGSSGDVATGATLTTTNNDFIQFSINTSGYSSISVSFDAARKNTPNSPQGIAVYYSSGTVNNPEPNAALYSNATALPTSTTAFSSFGSFTFTPTANTMYVRIYFFNSGNTAGGSDVFVDNVTFTGCIVPNPPTMTKAFSPNPVAIGATPTLTFTITNPNTNVAFTGVSFSDTLPSGLTVSTGSSTQCGGTLSTTAPQTISFSGGTLAASTPSTSCNVTVTVTATAAGNYNNVSGFVSSTEGGTNSGSTGSATASLTVLKPPSISKLFAPNPILAGGTSTLTFTITNPNLNNDLTGVAFSDNYPSGLQNASTPNASTTCTSGSVTAASGGGSLSLSGATVAAGSSCTVTVSVTAASVGTYANASHAVSSTNGGTGNTAIDTLTVNSPSPAISILKQVSTSATGPWTSFVAVSTGANVYYQFTIENVGDVPLTSISISDPNLPAAAIATCNSTWTDPLPVAVAGNNNHIDTCVVGPITATSGSHTNTATASGTYSGSTKTDTSSATYATTGLTLAKSAAQTSFTTAGDQLNYSYLITNSGSAPLLGPITVTDNKVTVTCPAVSTIGDLDAYLDPGENITCTATYTVTAADLTNGSVTNTASATVNGVSSNQDSETVNILRPDLTVTKSNNVGGVVIQNGTFNWTITVTNSGIADAVIPNGHTIMSDTLPGASGSYGAVTVTNGATPPSGTIDCSITGTALVCAANGAVTLPVGGSFSVTIPVTPTAFGSLANTATVDPSTVVLEINEGNNTGSNTVTVVEITAVDDTGATVTGTNGGQSLANVLANDTLNGSTPTLVNITLTQVSTTNAGVTLDTTTGAVNVAAGTPAGNYTLTYQICHQTYPTICDTATVSVPVVTIDAVNDTGSTVNGTAGGQAVANVLTNDTLNGNPATLANINLTQVSTTNAGVTLDVTTGAVSVAPGTPPGTHTVTYQICDKTNPTICDTATVTVTVVVIDAVNDTGSTVSGATGGQALVDVLANDTLNGNTPTLLNVNLTQVSTTNAGVTLDVTTGAVNVAPGTPAGTHTVTYQICDKANPTICDTASVSVPVTVIDAVNDSGVAVNGTSGGQSLADVLANDTLNGNLVMLADVNLTQVSTTNAGVTLDVTTGAVNVAPGTPAGNYTLTYQICDKANPTICDTATISVPVVTINAVNDTGSTVNGTTGGQSFANVLTNDTLNGSQALLSDVNLTQVSTTNPGVTLDLTTGAVNVAAGTPAGTHTLTYQICDKSNPTICDTATVTVPVVTIDAVNDTGSTVNGTTGGQSLANVLTNDALNGSQALLSDVNLTQVSTTNPGVTLDITTGAVNVAPGTPGGTHTLTYQICDKANPAICDTATVTVPVVVIDAVNDTGSTVNGLTGGQSLANVLANDALNGSQALLSDVNLTQVSTTNPGVTLNATTGAVNVAPGTPAGTHTLTYQICDKANPAICDTAAVTVPVSAAAIVATDDSASGVNGITGATGVLNVFDNDTLNGVPVIPANVTLTETVPDPSGALTVNPNGTVDVAPGTPGGTYQLTYQICEVLNPTNCATAVVQITVGTPAAPTAQDDSTTTPFNTPVTLTDITANDAAFGVGNSILTSTLDLDPATGGQQTSFTDTSGNQWSVNTTTGEVTFTPATNFTGTATIPYSVQDAAGQTAAADLIVTVGSPASLSGVVYHDLNLDGTQDPGEAGLGAVRIDLYDSTGTTLIASVNTAADGSYSFTNITPGDYLVVETDLAGYVSTTPNNVTATVTAGGSATVNFGDYQLSNSALSSINGTVFDDANANGLQDAGEADLSGVTVELRNNNGAVVATTTTNASGAYSFLNLAAGTYTVTETDPAGYISTTLNNVTVTLSAGTTATVNFGDQTSGAAQIADPAVTKFGSPSSATVGSAVVYTITVGNTGNTNATNVVLTDTKPAFLDFISITISPNPGLTPTIAGNTFTINFGTVTPTDAFVVTVLTRVNSLGQPPGGANNASLTTTSVTDRAFNNAASAALLIPSTGGGGGILKSVRALPATGFAPGVVTDLSHTPQQTYLSTDDVKLEIPSLGIKIPVVGVPLKNGTWNVAWLGKQVGWLEGSAFPSWNGNSVLTSHVYLANGLPGPFVNLNNLKYGDQIVIHAYGQKYAFEVSSSRLVEPNDTSIFKHEEKPWLTLVTCKEYDEKTNTYRKRVVVRAVLVSVSWE